MKTFSRTANKGFTLIELMIVILIMAVSATFFLSYKFAMDASVKRELTKTRMDDIMAAIVNFRQGNHRIPRPADPTLNVGSASFGSERVTGTCDPTTGATGETTNGRMGIVPTKTLGLSDDMMYDGWGRRFTYAVLYRFTTACAFTTAGNLMSDTISGFTINDENGVARTTEPVYVLVSHGINGHGGYLQSGSRYSASSTNLLEQNNCNCNSSATATSSDSPANLDMTFIEASNDIDNPTDPTNRFDDIIRYAIRQNIRSVEEENNLTETCP